MKNTQKSPKYNTIPNGKGIVGIMWFLTILTFFLGALLIPKTEGFGLLGGGAIFLLITIILYLKKYSNVLIFTDEKIILKKKSLTWEEAYLTIYCFGPDFMRNSCDIYVFFDNHYLTVQEACSWKIRKKGFYLMLTYERTTCLLSHYSKRVRVLNTAPIDRDGVMSLVFGHNSIH